MGMDVFVLIYYANVGCTRNRNLHLDLFDCTSVFHLHRSIYQFNATSKIKQTLRNKKLVEIQLVFILYRKLHHKWCRLIH